MKNVLSESDLLKKQVSFLKTQNEQLKSEIARLNEILKQHEILYSSSLLENGDSVTFNEILQTKKNFLINPSNQNPINFIEPTRELVSLFYSYFKGDLMFMQNAVVHQMQKLGSLVIIRNVGTFGKMDFV